MQNILLVEDDDPIAELIIIYLTEEGFEIRRASTGKEFEQMFEQQVPDLFILDYWLPDTDGFTLCRFIRETSNVPILMLSAMNETKYKIDALMTGADDYLGKPFSMRELAARVMALLRRSNTQLKQEKLVIKPLDGICIESEKRKLIIDGQLIETTYFEYELMKIFLKHPGHVFEREQLLNHIKGLDSDVSDRSVDVHIKNLRKKIERDSKDPKRIQTVRGVGYKYEPE